MSAQTNRMFISYRSSDGKKDANRLAEDLCKVFGDEQVFFDKHDLRGGSSWRDEIFAAIHNRPIVLLVLTPDYFGCKHEDGRLRLDDTDDPVRQELGATIQTRATLMPLLGEGVTMPSAASLPLELRGVTEKHALRLRTDDWRNDLVRVIDDLIRLGVKPLREDWRILFGLDVKPRIEVKPWFILIGLAFLMLLFFEVGAANEPGADTFYGAAFLTLIPIGMVWLAYTKLKDAGKWPKYGAIAMLVITVWEMLSFVGRGLNYPHPDQQGQNPVPVPGSVPTPVPVPVPQAAPKPVQASTADLTGSWLAVIGNTQSLPFVLKQQGDSIHFSSNRLDVTNDPWFQSLNMLLSRTYGFVVRDIRMRGEGTVENGEIDADMNLSSGDGAHPLDQGSLILTIAQDGRSLSGHIHFNSGQPTSIRFERR